MKAHSLDKTKQEAGESGGEGPVRGSALGLRGCVTTWAGAATAAVGRQSPFPFTSLNTACEAPVCMERAVMRGHSSLGRGKRMSRTARVTKSWTIISRASERVRALVQNKVLAVVTKMANFYSVLFWRENGITAHRRRGECELESCWNTETNPCAAVFLKAGLWITQQFNTRRPEFTFGRWLFLVKLSKSVLLNVCFVF